MAARCTSTRNLEVHHLNRGAGASLSNAKVLCQSCHSKTRSYGQPGFNPTDFTQSVKDAALERAGYRCECIRDFCH